MWKFFVNLFQGHISLWKENHISELHGQGKQLIDGGKLTRARIEEVLEGTNVLNKFSLTQIRARIVSERHER